MSRHLANENTETKSKRERIDRMDCCKAGFIVRRLLQNEIPAVLEQIKNISASSLLMGIITGRALEQECSVIC